MNVISFRKLVQCSVKSNKENIHYTIDEEEAKGTQNKQAPERSKLRN